MLRAIDRSGQLRDVRAVRGWLSQILASSIADYGRKVGRQRQREVVMAPTDLDNIQDGFDEELDEAKAALHMLHTIHTGTIDTKTGRNFERHNRRIALISTRSVKGLGACLRAESPCREAHRSS